MSSLLISSTLHSELLPQYLSSVPVFDPIFEDDTKKFSSEKLPYSKEQATQYLIQLQNFLIEKRTIFDIHTHCLDYTPIDISFTSKEEKKTQKLYISQKAHALLLLTYALEEQHISLSTEINSFNTSCLQFKTLFTVEDSLEQYLTPLQENTIDDTLIDSLFVALAYFLENDTILVSSSTSIFERCLEKNLVQELPDTLLPLCSAHNITPYIRGYVCAPIDHFFPSFSYLSSGNTIQSLFCFEENIS